jgi:hypothetical protein
MLNLIKKAAAVVVVATQILSSVPTASAFTPDPNLTVDKVLTAAQSDVDTLLMGLNDLRDANSLDVRFMSNKTRPAGLVPFAFYWAGNELKNYPDKYKEQSPGDDSNVSVGLNLLSWSTACLYLPFYIEGYNVSYDQFYATFLKHKEDNDEGKKLIEDLQAEAEKVKGKGAIPAVFAKAKEYALLLENEKPGSGVGFLIGGTFREFMSDVYHVALGFKPYSAGTCIKAATACTVNEQCTMLNDACNPIGVIVTNPCMIMMSIIISTNYYGPTLWDPGEVTQHTPYGDDNAYESSYAYMLGEQAGNESPCLMYGSNCTPGFVARYYKTPGKEVDIVNNLSAATNRIANYVTELDKKITELKTKGAKAAPDADASARTAARIGSALSLPLPLSDISPTSLVARIISAVLGIVGSLSLLIFVYGGIIWMTARGDSKKVAQGKAALVWAALGIVAIFSAYSVLSLVTSTLTG